MKQGILSQVKEKAPIVLFVSSFLFTAFAVGVVTTSLNVFPATVLTKGYDELMQIFKAREERKNHHLFPIRYESPGASVHDASQMMPGLTLLTSFWREDGKKLLPGARLIDHSGNELHKWQISPPEVWPESPHDDPFKGTRNIDTNYIHGSYLFPNGDLLFNLEHLGLVRVNACGEIVWKLPHRTHHSLFLAESGNFWVPESRWLEAGDERLALYPGLGTPVVEEFVLEVSPEGKVLREISFLASLYESNLQHVLWPYRFGPKPTPLYDIFHLNDVEVLGSDLAEQFPLFEAGDILVSLRNLSMIWVIGQDGAIKWRRSGEFAMQHDPDFEEGGWISVFDNSADVPRANTKLGFSSRIRSVNPATEAAKTLYSGEDNDDFYTAAGGKHQKLANGNRLITEARAGRVFEVTASGKTIWEWVNEPANKKSVPEVLEGTRYDLSKTQVAAWQCSSAP